MIENKKITNKETFNSHETSRRIYIRTETVASKTVLSQQFT